MLKKSRCVGESVRMASLSWIDFVIRHRTGAPDKARPLFRRSLLSSTSLVALGWLAATTPSRASDLWFGATNSDWFFANNWTTGVPTSTTDVNIGASSEPFYPVIQAFPPFTAIAQTGSILVSGPGTLTLQSEAKLTNQLDANIAAGGKVTVTGERTVWTNNGTIVVGSTGPLNTQSLLNIQGGAQVITKDLQVGQTGAIGVVTVDGLGSNLTVTNNLKVGAASLGVGTLTVQNGANLKTSGLAGVQIGDKDSFATSTITLKGQGSYWINDNGPIIVGASGTGTLNIRDATTLFSSAPIIIARDSGSVGTLNFGAELGQVAVQPGGLMAPSGLTPIILFGRGIGEIVFNHTDSNYVFAPIMYGPGSLLVEAGTTILTGASGTTYTGTATVDGGVLIVNGSIASSSLTTVNAGGTLGGNGTVGNTTINGGTLSPGNSIGLLNVQGSLAFTAASSYLVEVSPANADRTNVTGAATLGGATVNAVFANGSYLARQYNILSASGGVSGTFASGVVNTNLPKNFATSLSYDANDVYLNLTAQLGGGGVGGVVNGNQQSVASSINNAFNSGGALPPGFLNLFNLSGAPLANALTQLSGETASGSQQTTLNAMSQFMGLLTDPFVRRSGGFGGSSLSSGYADEALAYAANKRTDALAMFTKAPPTAPFEQRWSVWGAGFGGSQSTDGNATVGSNNTRSSIAGTAVGADYLISPTTLAGFALSGGGTSFSVANGGTGRSDLFQLGAYLYHTNGAAYVSAGLAYGWQDITTDRTVTVAGLDQLRAHFNANAFSGRLEGGYRFVSPASFGIGITPYAAAQFVTFDLPSYAEQAIVGTNNFALGYGAREVTNERSELGLRTDQSFLIANGILTLWGRFAWAHDFDPNRSVGATFQTLPGASFVVNGAAQAADSALTTASIEMKWKNGWSAAATFEGEFSNVTQSYAGKGGLRYRW